MIVNGYFVDTYEGWFFVEFDGFLARIESDPDGCRWFEWFVPTGE